MGTTGGSPRVQDHREWEILGGVMREAGLKVCNRDGGPFRGGKTFTSAFFRKRKTNTWSPWRYTMQDTLSLKDSLETRLFIEVRMINNNNTMKRSDRRRALHEQNPMNREVVSQE